MLASFGLTGGSVPDESTLRKFFARLDADALDRALGIWMWARTFTVDERRVIALDGKTVRGARTRPTVKPRTCSPRSTTVPVPSSASGCRREEQ